MVAPPAVEGPSSLLGATIRRSIVIGRIYLIVGIGYSVIIGIVLSLVSATSFGSTVPLLLPIFAVVGSMGGLTVFTNDRLKGVFEYLIAYGVSPRRLFANVLASSLVLATIVLGTSLAFDLGVYLAKGHIISALFAMALALYTFPMTYASVAFAATIGMFWTSLSSPRSGMTSSIGVMPLIGIAPSIITLLGAAAAPAYWLYILTGAALLVTAVVLLLVGLIRRLMPLERLLSPV